jgi:hypothetical protein
MFVTGAIDPGELIERWSQDDADLTGREAFDDDESPAASGPATR